MASRLVTYCCDANVFLAWLGEEATASLGDIDLVFGEIDRKVASLLVPVTAYSEVLEARHTPAQMEKFRRLLDRSNVVVADTTKTIAERAGLIRSRGIEAKPRRIIKTPDATFMATAIIYRATVFHTLETTQLPGLSGTDIVDKLVITAPKPWSSTPSMFNPDPGEPKRPS